MTAITPIFIPIITGSAGDGDITISKWYLITAALSYFIMLFIAVRITKESFGSPLDGDEFIMAAVTAIIMALIFPLTCFIGGMWLVYKRIQR